MAQKVRKAVIPVAGLGTRFLPATKAVPKEMLPIVDKPTLQYIVEEAFAAGVEHIVLVQGRYKGSIEDHFDASYELEDTLEKRGKTADLELVRKISRMGSISSVRQKAPLGLGHAVLCAKAIIGDEPFACSSATTSCARIRVSARASASSSTRLHLQAKDRSRS